MANYTRNMGSYDKSLEPDRTEEERGREPLYRRLDLNPEITKKMGLHWLLGSTGDWGNSGIK